MVGLMAGQQTKELAQIQQALSWARAKHKWERGETATAIAKELKVPVSTVTRRSKREGWTKINAKNRVHRDAEAAAEIMRLQAREETLLKRMGEQPHVPQPAASERDDILPPTQRLLREVGLAVVKPRQQRGRGVADDEKEAPAQAGEVMAPGAGSIDMPVSRLQQINEEQAAIGRELREAGMAIVRQLRGLVIPPEVLSDPNREQEVAAAVAGGRALAAVSPDKETFAGLLRTAVGAIEAGVNVERQAAGLDGPKRPGGGAAVTLNQQNNTVNVDAPVTADLSEMSEDALELLRKVAELRRSEQRAQEIERNRSGT